MATQTNVQNNWWWKYFTRQNKFVTCNICNAISSRQRAPAHLYRSHNITDQEVILQWNNDNHLIWQHFSKKDLFSAECNFCGILFKSAYDKGSLDAHLRLVHSQEIAAIRENITRTWVSPHFTFDCNSKIYCKHCDYSVKIYDGVDVLKNHLNEDHDIDEYFENRKEKKLVEYLGTTMQCTEEIEVPFSRW